MNSTEIPLILEPEALTPLMGQPDILLIDLSQGESYVKQHLPGAVFLDYSWVVDSDKPRVGLLPDEQRLSHLLSAYGIGENTHVIAYDDEGGGRACRFLFTLDCLGHQRFSLLNGGLYAWLHDGRDTEQAIHFPQAVQRTVSFKTDPIADKQFILEHLQDNAVAIVDTRSPQEFMGTKLFAARGGHIPGAIHYEWTRAMDEQRKLRLKPADDLRQTLNAEGITPDKTIVCHCHSHHRSAHTYIVLKSLEYEKVKGYPGSWSEWGNDPTTPIES
ncbi:MAG: sulfurtransferase [Gammaproteobacteria bacterium]